MSRATRNAPSPLKLDLGSQRLLIGPDDPLPKFYPRPKAIMVIPIYHDVEVVLMGPTIAPHIAHSDSPYAFPGRSPHTPLSPHRYPSSGDKPHLQTAGETDYSFEHHHSDAVTPESHEVHPHAGNHHSPSKLASNSARPPLSPTKTTSGNHILQDLKDRHQAFHEAIGTYCLLLPPNPQFCRSQCSGRKRAVCIGINYIGQKHELKGCANDARNMREFLIQQYHFPSEEVLLLTDDDRHNRMPTRDEMFKAMAWLVHGAKKDDSLFFHYSGHGGQVKNENGREIDGMDEDIFPVDAADAGDIIDDDLHKALVHTLPAGCRLTAIFDSCHSGTVLDLPYIHSAHGRLRNISHISKRARARGVADSADVICFSACKDDETSADTFSGGVAVGAMSFAFIRALEQDHHQSYDELLTHLRETLIPKYQQKAQISCTQPLELDRQFTL